MDQNCVRVRKGKRILFVNDCFTWRSLSENVASILAVDKESIAFYTNGKMFVFDSVNDTEVPPVVFLVEKDEKGNWASPDVEEFPQFSAGSEDRFPTLPQSLIDYVNDLKPCPHTC